MAVSVVAVWRLAGADDEGAAGGFDDVVGEGLQVVDLHDAFDLGEQSVDEPKVASGDAGDGGDGLGVGEVVDVQVQAESAPLPLEDEGEFFEAERPVVVGEADPAVELGEAAELLFDTGHTDQDQRDVVAIVAVAEDFQTGRVQAFGFVDDDESNVLFPPAVAAACAPGVRSRAGAD